MTDYPLKLDAKVVIWRRCHVSVKANSEEEAAKKLMEIVNKEDWKGLEVLEHKMLYETEDYAYPKQLKILNEKGKTILTYKEQQDE